MTKESICIGGNEAMSKSSHHFVLIHGSCHGAWCWYKLCALLKLSGHRATALDLGASGINPKSLHQVSDVSDYVAPLMDFMASALISDQKVVLVGHSFAGLCISLAMERFPSKISVAVFLTAYMPRHDSVPASLIEEYFKRTEAESLLDSRITFKDNKPVSAIFGPEYMKKNVYPRSQPEDLELGLMLIRPSGLFVEDFGKEKMVTEGKFGSVRRVYIVCEEDRVMTEEFQRWMISESQPEAVMSVREADHMVMLSNPNALCQCLLQLVGDDSLARNYC